MTTPDDKVSK